tara:strand:- start:840 stop:1307 length:468 start_codon:yes stop_codon:yes gene_type:complete
MAQLQPRWPLKIDTIHGPYSPIEDVAESIHQDFLQLLKTIPGEWPGRPDLGIGLIKFLFETPNSPEFNSVKSRIKNQVSKYLKVVEVTKIDIQSPPDLIDYNQVRIVIEYYIKPLGINRTMGLIAQDGNLQELLNAIADLSEGKATSPYHVRGSL